MQLGIKNGVKRGKKYGISTKYQNAKIDLDLVIEMVLLVHTNKLE